MKKHGERIPAACLSPSAFNPKTSGDRRNFLRRGAAAVGSIALAGLNLAKGSSLHYSSAAGDDIPVSLSEDLMREHGVLKRVLLVYGEITERLAGEKDFPPEALTGAADIIRKFIEDYHEKLEEDYLFPRFEKAGKMVELVRVLRIQHERGRLLTDLISGNAGLKAIGDPDKRSKLIRSIRQFIRMYNPHEAREDTVLFPAFRTIVSSHEYDSLGEEFEEKEHEMFGEDGFEKYVVKVAELEKLMGMYDLSKFTPEIK